MLVSVSDSEPQRLVHHPIRSADDPLNEFGVLLVFRDGDVPANHGDECRPSAAWMAATAPPPQVGSREARLTR